MSHDRVKEEVTLNNVIKEGLHEEVTRELNPARWKQPPT